MRFHGTYLPFGVFVCFEGGEGSGKSTQSRLLADRLQAAGHVVRLTFEPGDTPVGAEMRRIVLSPETGELSHRTEVLLYAADKAEHVDTVVIPALERGEVVITDRYVDSTLAYQGAGRDLDVDEVEEVARWATGDLRPHLTVVLDVDPSEGLGRFEGRDRIEGESWSSTSAPGSRSSTSPRRTPITTSSWTRRADRDEIAAADRRAGHAAPRRRPERAGRDRLGRPGRPAPHRRGCSGPRPAATA